MTQTHQEWLEKLNEQLSPIMPEDSMSEAGRKILLVDMIRMLKHEAGSRSGEDLEDVHQMRVATRRMRSALRMFAGHLQLRGVKSIRRNLRMVAQALGAVRDLDIMIEELRAYQATLGDTQRGLLTAIIAYLDAERTDARQELNRLLDSKAYQKFVARFCGMLTETAADPAQVNSVVPYQVRHLLPDLIYKHVAAVRAYDTVIEGAIAEMELPVLHQLRIEFKRLRYAVQFFNDVMGSQAESFINDLKAIQDHLGRINDLHVASENLEALLEQSWLTDEQASLVRSYADSLVNELPQLIEDFGDVWRKFNTKAVQRKLAAAVVV